MYNRTNNIVRKAVEGSWDKFISNIENDIHGRQEVAYKIMRQLLKQEKDTAHLHTRDKDTWMEHYRELWTEQEEDSEKHENEHQSPNLTTGSDYYETPYTEDKVTPLEKLQVK